MLVLVFSWNLWTKRKIQYHRPVISENVLRQNIIYCIIYDPVLPGMYKKINPGIFAHYNREDTNKGKHLSRFVKSIEVSSTQKHRFSSTSSSLQFDLHGVLVCLVACAEDRRLHVLSFCRSFHRKKVCISCLLLNAEGSDEVTVINMSEVKKDLL